MCLEQDFKKHCYQLVHFLTSKSELKVLLTDSPTLAINDVRVSEVTITKSFGVIIEDKLDWSSHIEKLQS